MLATSSPLQKSSRNRLFICNDLADFLGARMNDAFAVDASKSTHRASNLLLIEHLEWPFEHKLP
jgi:hypothetical protein